MAETKIRPQQLRLNVTNTTAPNNELENGAFAGMLWVDANNILRVDSVGSGDPADFIPVIPEHTVAGGHGPKVTITQTANDNALIILKSGTKSAASIVATGTNAGSCLELISNSHNNIPLQITQNGDATAVDINVNGTGTALRIRDGDLIVQSADAEIVNGTFTVNTDRLVANALNVGIGTDSPDVNRILDIRGSVAIHSSHLYLKNQGAPTGKKSWGMLISNSNGQFSLGVTSDTLPAGGSLIRTPFVVLPDAPTNSLVVQSDGDIGIGTASPVAKLEVQQSGNGKGLFVEKQAGTDDSVHVQNYSGLGGGYGLHLDNSTNRAALWIQQRLAGSDEALLIDNSGTQSESVVINHAGGSSSVIDVNCNGGSGNVVDLNNVGNGNVVHINNFGSGYDIRGNAGNWWIDKNGNFHGNNLLTKVASGLAAPSSVNGEVTINFVSGTATNGTYSGATGFTQTPHVIFGVGHSGTHPDTDNHWWSATITSLTSSEMKIKMDSSNIGAPPNLYYWLAIGV